MLLALAMMTARAATLGDVPDCAVLVPEDLKRASALTQTERGYACCQDTVAACLAAPQPCALTTRLAAEICRRVDAGEDDQQVSQHLALRASSMVPTDHPATFDLSRSPPLGDASAPVQVVVYACVRCPYCARLVPQLIEAVASGPLKGKARLYYRPFPLKGHAGSTEGALATLAARDQGLFWQVLGREYADFDDFSVDTLPGRVVEVGGERAAWQTAYDAPATRQELVDSKREGLANGVNSTPTVFISGRQWEGSLDATELVDAIEEEYDRLVGKER